MMKAKKLFFLLFFLLANIQAKHAVTYKLNGGRFGDNLMSYISAAYFAYCNKLQLLYKKFDYSDLLVLSDIQPRPTLKRKHFTQEIEYSENLNVNDYDPAKPVLFVTTFYNRPRPTSADLDFRKKMKKVISPKVKINCPNIPKDHMSVAIHIRTGGGFKMDKQLYTEYPTRFAPLHFYSDQLKRLLSLYPKKKLYVHIFTDDQDPEHIVAYLKKEVPSNRVKYGYREKGNTHNHNVLDDFFSLLNFTCLIRPTSNFSKVAEFLGDYEIVIVPVTYHKIEAKKWVIDTVRFSQRKNGKLISKKVPCAPEQG